MRKYRLIFIFVVLSIVTTPAFAKLSDEQLAEVISKFKNKMPHCPTDQVRKFVLNHDCAPNVFQEPLSIACGGEEHQYACRWGLYYLDDEVISILSSKTDIYNTSIRDSNIMKVDKIENSKVSQTVSKSNKNWVLKIVLDINFYIGVTATLTISFIVGILRRRCK